jgi:hypothetical protein
VATNVAGLPDCMHLQSLGTKTKGDNDDHDLRELLEKAATGNGSQKHKVTREVADRVAGIGEKVKADQQFAGQIIDAPAGAKRGLGCASIREVPSMVREISAPLAGLVSAGLHK